MFGVSDCVPDMARNRVLILYGAGSGLLIDLLVQIKLEEFTQTPPTAVVPLYGSVDCSFKSDSRSSAKVMIIFLRL